MPRDFFLANKLGQLVGFIQISVTANMVWGAVLLILILAAYTYLNKKFVIKKTQTLKQKIIFGIKNSQFYNSRNFFISQM